MVKLGSCVKIYDNSGAKKVSCYNLGIKQTRKVSRCIIGDFFGGSVKRYVPLKKITRKQKVKVVVVTSKIQHKLKNGIYFRYSETRGIVLRDGAKPLGSRIKTYISSLVQSRFHFNKITRLSSISKGYI